MEISKRKNTTKKAIEELKNLIDSLNKKGFSSDVDKVQSREFFAKVETDNGLNYGDIYYRDWYNFNAVFVIEKGSLKIKSIDEEQDLLKCIDIDRYEQINFKGCIESLKDAILKYNELCLKKDKQIESFLNFCENWKKEKETL